MIETYAMRLQRQQRERVEELRRKTRTTRGYGNDFVVAEVAAPEPHYSWDMTPNNWSPSDSGCSSSSD